MKQEIAQELLEKVKSDYQQIYKEFSVSRQELWTELLDFKKYVKNGDRVLDLGCGNGRLYQLFTDINIDYLGIDSSPELIKEAQKNNSQAKFMMADILNLPLFPQKFDIIFCIAVLHHIPSEKLRLVALNNIKNLLKKDGLLILTVWNLFQPKYIFYVIKPLLFLLNPCYPYDPFDTFIPWKKTGIRRYYHAFRKSELKNLVQKAGFNVLDIYSTGRNLCLIARNP